LLGPLTLIFYIRSSLFRGSPQLPLLEGGHQEDHTGEPEDNEERQAKATLDAMQGNEQFSAHLSNWLSFNQSGTPCSYASRVAYLD